MQTWDEVFPVLDQIEQEQGRGPAHQVGGNPGPVQGPVELEVAYGHLSREAWTRSAGRTRPSVRPATTGSCSLSSTPTTEPDSCGAPWDEHDHRAAAGPRQRPGLSGLTRAAS